jgi:chromosome segregation ATPase
MAEIQGLERRTIALENAQNETTQTLKWVVARLGRMSAVQDEHTLRFERVETRLTSVENGLAEVRADIAEVRADIAGLRQGLPGIIAEVMREVLRERK